VKRRALTKTLEDPIMQRIYVLTIAVLLIAWAGIQRELGAQQAWVGVISDGMCRADHGGGEIDPKECTQKCVKNGEKYVLVTERGATILPIANQDFDALFGNAGDTVRVTGELRDGAIVVSKLELSR